MSTARKQLAINFNPHFAPNPQRKITPAQRQEIQYRRFEGEDVKHLAVEYGISAGYLRNSFPPVERPFEL